MDFIKTSFVVPTAKARAGILRALTAIRELFGPHGENWMKGDEHAEYYPGDFHPKTGKRLKEKLDQFCLIGGVREVDGAYEDGARIALTLAIDSSIFDDADYLYRYDEDVQEDTITTYNDASKRSFRDICDVIKKAKRLVEDAPQQ